MSGEWKYEKSAPPFPPIVNLGCVCMCVRACLFLFLWCQTCTLCSALCTLFIRLVPKLSCMFAFPVFFIAIFFRSQRTFVRLFAVCRAVPCKVQDQSEGVSTPYCWGRLFATHPPSLSGRRRCCISVDIKSSLHSFVVEKGGLPFSLSRISFTPIGAFSFCSPKVCQNTAACV